ncbi:helix-turn-helix domain-containing protein (plasmid) [Amycolatopsis sp. FU40]|uniref:helix-turn-helix domain-containing protein n=1 Tax=Amycolatopsis sp. FU40 TaxID=2914159 RepID=UPI001F3D799C|nr:helix-turn-helix domain-containing protein [Amycolatopsis sp. FU40]UKD50802.1 helix-turn-helix domain-containing protein [Amycolatopsis sp. FU40]
MALIEITKTDAKAIAAAVQANADDDRHGRVTVPGGLTLDFTAGVEDPYGRRGIRLTLLRGPERDAPRITWRDGLTRTRLGEAAAQMVNDYRRSLAIESAGRKLHAAQLRQLGTVGERLRGQFGGSVPGSNSGAAVWDDPEKVRLLDRRDEAIHQALASIPVTGIPIADEEITELTGASALSIEGIRREVPDTWSPERLRLDIEDVALFLGVGVQAVRNHRTGGRLPSEDETHGGRPYWRPETIAAWLARRPGAGARTDLAGS